MRRSKESPTTQTRVSKTIPGTQRRCSPSTHRYRKRYPAHNNDTTRAVTGIENDTRHTITTHHGQSRVSKTIPGNKRDVTEVKRTTRHTTPSRVSYPAHHNDTLRATSGIENDTQRQMVRHNLGSVTTPHRYRKRYPAVWGCNIPKITESTTLTSIKNDTLNNLCSYELVTTLLRSENESECYMAIGL